METSEVKATEHVVLYPTGPEYLHVSKRVGVIERRDAAGVVTTRPFVEPRGITHNIGRNAEKRRLRVGKPRKQWVVAK